MKKIVVIGPAWVGDMVMSQSLYRVLKQQHPEATLTVMAPSYTLPLLQAMPEVDEAIAGDFPRKKLSLLARWKLGKSLKSRGFTDAFVLPNSFKSALVPFFAGIPKRTGFVGECRYGVLNDARRLDKAALPKMIDRFCALAFPKGEPLPSMDWPLPALKMSDTTLALAREKYGIQSDTNVLALCPGAEFGPAKQWPAEHFAGFARKKLEAGWKVWIFGSKKDETISTNIAMRLSDFESAVSNFSGKTSLEDAMALLSLADLVVSNDSGLMHIASALGRPVIAIYGSTSPGFTPPLSKSARIVKLDLPCQPCFKRVCPFKPDDPRHMACLRELTPEYLDAEGSA